MLKNYFKIAVRNLFKNRSSSLINIGGLATGMAVAILIGLWIHEELSYNKAFDNYDRIGKVWQFVKFDGDKAAYDVMPIPLAEELRTKYPDFKYVSLSSQHRNTILASGNDKFTKTGSYVQPDLVDMLSVKMTAGDRNGLKDINSIMLSETLSKTIFGTEDPINKIIRIDNKLPVKVTGIYKDFPENSAFNDVFFLAPWDLYVTNDPNASRSKDDWDSNSWQLFVQLREGADFATASARIKETRMIRADPPRYHPEFFVHPMRKWHLYSDFKNGINTGGYIEIVWLFGIIGVFVLLLACINFMNLSTARSEKRAKEVGIRKAVGSVRRQLIFQFFCESLVVVLFSFALSLLLVQLALPFFNDISGKHIAIIWLNPLFWLAGIAFSLLTGLVAGSYPALYLSSFQPIKVLKGTFRAGRLAAIPRKVLVVFQFSVSVFLIIGTVIVFRQIQHAKSRPVGYSRNGLIEVRINTPELRKNYQVLRADLLNSGAVYELSASSCSVAEQDGGTTDFSWPGKPAGFTPLVMSNNITYEFGKTIGWQIVQGRDFDRTYATDSAAIILNETAVAMTGFKEPVGEMVRRSGKDYKVIGVVRDMVKESPFSPVKPTFFTLGKGLTTINIKLAPKLGAAESLAKTGSAFKKYDPESPFVYKFVDNQFARKFENEERIGKLAAFFAILAIFISCLGLFGLASFIAEQRTKEISVRKVLGASIFNVWRLLSREFVTLVSISLFIAIPAGYYFMSQWLQNYDYRTELSWWIFLGASIGALTITLLTVSFQAIKAALANPVKSLRSE